MINFFGCADRKLVVHKLEFGSMRRKFAYMGGLKNGLGLGICLIIIPRILLRYPGRSLT